MMYPPMLLSLWIQHPKLQFVPVSISTIAATSSHIGLCLLKFGSHKPTSTSPIMSVYPCLDILMMTIQFLVSLIVSIHIVPFCLMILTQTCCHPNMILFYKMISMGSSILTLLTILTLIWTSILVFIPTLENLHSQIMILFPSTGIRINVLIMSMGSIFIGKYPVLMCLCLLMSLRMMTPSHTIIPFGLIIFIAKMFPVTSTRAYLIIQQRLELTI